MPVELNHTIVASRDKHASAAFLAEVLGLRVGPEFSAIMDRIRRAGLTYYADPGRNQPGRINHDHGGRGAYFDDPDGHNLEILTQPYGNV
jgi:catechol 2,3-dioxygenase-like lactoylglutathione lyase family enzyme